MKAAIAWMAITAVAVAASGQSAATGVAGSTQSSTSQTSAAGSEYAAVQSSQASAAQATAVSAELSKKIDTKDAKAGDQVVAKTTGEARLADGTRLPKGSKLVGHVTDVQAKSRDNRDSHLAFAFDHAVLKDGREVPVRAMMQSLSAPTAMAASSSDDMMASSSMAPGDGASMARNGGSGHASVGGISGAVPGSAGTTASGLANNVTSGAAVNGAGNLGANGTPLNNAAGLNAGPSGQTLGQAMPVGNLYGVTFNAVSATAGASNGGVSGSAGSSNAILLTGHGRNFSLESGSQMTLSVAPQ